MPNVDDDDHIVYLFQTHITHITNIMSRSHLRVDTCPLAAELPHRHQATLEERVLVLQGLQLRPAETGHLGPGWPGMMGFVRFSGVPKPPWFLIMLYHVDQFFPVK